MDPLDPLDPVGRWEPEAHPETCLTGAESTVCDPDTLDGMPGPFRLVGFSAVEV